MSTRTTLPAPWQGLIDDAAIFPPGDAPLPDAVEAFVARRGAWYADLVDSFVVRDTDLPDLLEIRGLSRSRSDHVEIPEDRFPISIVVTGGAGGIGPAAKWADALDLRGIETTLRDPDDLTGAARRVAAAVDNARAEGLDDEVPVYVELPHVGSTATWQAAADVVAENGFRLKFRTGGLEAHLFPAPHALASWINAALDRETAFKCTAGLHNALRHRDDETGFDHHGFLNVLVATRMAFDGSPLNEVAELLDQRDAAAVLAAADGVDLAGARRWFTSYGSCSITEPLNDLVGLGLLETPSEPIEIVTEDTR